MSEPEKPDDLMLTGERPSTLYQYYASTTGEIGRVLVSAIVTRLYGYSEITGSPYSIIITVEAGPLDTWTDTVDEFNVRHDENFRAKLDQRVRESVAEALPHLIYNRNERQQRKQEIALLEGDKE